MKKILAGFLAVILLLTLCGCSQSQPNEKFLLKNIKKIEEIPDADFTYESAHFQPGSMVENGDEKTMTIDYYASADDFCYVATIEMTFSKDRKQSLKKYKILESSFTPSYELDAQIVFDEILKQYGKKITKFEKSEKISDIEYRYECKYVESDGGYVDTEYIYSVTTVFDLEKGWVLKDLKENKRYDCEKLEGKWEISTGDKVFLLNIYKSNYENIYVEYEYKSGNKLSSSRFKCKIFSADDKTKYSERKDVKCYIDLNYVSNWFDDVNKEDEISNIVFDISSQGIFESNGEKINAAVKREKDYHLEYSAGTLVYVIVNNYID